MPIDSSTFPMVLAWAVPFFVVSILIEWVFVRKGKWAGRYDTKDALTSMFMGLGNLISDLTMGFVSLAVLMWAWQFQPWNNHFTGFVLLSTPLVFLGVHPLLLGFVGALNLVYQYWIHTEAIDKMPRWFEAVFTDIKYGLVRNVETYNPFKIAFAEMWGAVKDISAPRLKLRDRLKYAFAPPGWSHDGSRQSSADIKADYVAQNPHLSGTPGLPKL